MGLLARFRNHLCALAGSSDRSGLPCSCSAKKEHGVRMTSLPLASLLTLLTEPVGVAHYLVVGAVLFVCGALCMATKRNAIGVLMGIELVLNGANLNFIAFGSPYLRNDAGAIGLDGQLMSLFVIVLAAAEAAVALAIALNFYNSFNTIDVDQADQLQG